jgi:type VI secretion system protein ImpH
VGAAIWMEGPDLNLALLERSILEDPHAFDFFAAVRALERLRPARAPVAGLHSDPEEEVVHFSVPTSLSYPASQIQALELAADGPARMTVNFMGLTGPSGVLPYEYTQLLIDRRREGDGSAAAFLDLFHHRIISLFYRAWEKHRFTVRYEKTGEDPLTTHLMDLGGLMPNDPGPGPGVRPDSLAYYAGLMAPQQRSAVALEQLVSDYFDVPVRVEQFVGGWYSVGQQDQCELDTQDDAGRLGMGALVGDEIYDPQGRVRIRLGPLSRTRYESFLPTGKDYEQLRSLARLFSHDQFEFEIQLVLTREEVPAVTLGDPTGAERLGWTTWALTRAKSADADETVLRI